MSVRLNILHIAPHLAQGGAERILHLVATSSNATIRHKVVLMEETVFFGRDGLDVSSLGFDLNRRTGAMVRMLPAMAALRRLVEQERPDIVQGWLYYGAFLSLALARHGTPVVWSIHNTTLPAMMRNPVLHVVDRALARASGLSPTRIIYCAETARAFHETRGYAKKAGIVIPNGIDTHRFRPNPERRSAMRRELALGDDTTAIGLFCRYDPQKDVPGCLDAIARLLRKRGNVVVLLAGHGMDCHNRALARLLVTHGLDGRCRLLGPFDRMEALTNAADLVVLGSRYGEAMPLVLLEALASSVPVVATLIGDVGA